MEAEPLKKDTHEYARMIHRVSIDALISFVLPSLPHFACVSVVAISPSSPRSWNSFKISLSHRIPVFVANEFELCCPISSGKRVQEHSAIPRLLLAQTVTVRLSSSSSRHTYIRSTASQCSRDKRTAIGDTWVAPNLLFVQCTVWRLSARGPC